jgi:hypothetical protein
MSDIRVPQANVMNEISAPGSDDCDDTIEARACIQRFADAFNAGDLAGMDAELNFPHTMLSGAHRLEWSAPGQLPGDFFRSLRATGWARTHTESITPVLTSTDKVHFVVDYSRRNAEGHVLNRYQNLWIVTRSAGHWGISLRSY